MPDRLSPQAERLLRKLVAMPKGAGLLLDSADRETAFGLVAGGLAEESLARKDFPRYYASLLGAALVAQIDRERQIEREVGRV